MMKFILVLSVSVISSAGSFSKPQFHIRGSTGVELLVTNPQSKKLGFDPITKKKYSEIKDSNFDHGDNIDGATETPATETETTLYVDAQPGRYKLEVFGLKNTEYKIESAFNSLPIDKTTLEIKGKIKTGEKQSFEFEVTKDQNIIRR